MPMIDTRKRLAGKAGGFLRKLARCKSGVAMTEFALALPLLLGAGMYGGETANFALTTSRINQIALQIADNGSRIGDTSTLQMRKIYESDLNEIFLGSDIQAGEMIDLYKNGRVIISSLEVYKTSTHCTAAGVCPPTAADPGDQFIHWQRCKGKKPFHSSYGKENDVKAVGMGPVGDEVSANEDDAIIFVEISYDYQPLISETFTFQKTISAIAAFNVRDERDLSKIYQRDPTDPDTASTCNVFDEIS